jgi:RimJ/RimL family protein N-acetyltransferase
MSGEVTVREAVEADFDAWFDLYERVAAERIHIAAEPPVDRDRRRPGFQRFVTDPHWVMLMAETDGRVVGHLGVELEGGVAGIGMLVAPEARGTGVGSKLMAACVDWCRAKNAHKIALTLWPHNTAARALYEKFGFVEEGRLIRHYRRSSGELWDAITMGLILDTESPGSSL